MVTRSSRRRAAKEQSKAIEQGMKDQALLSTAKAGLGEPASDAIDVRIEDIQMVLQENPQFNQLVVNAALRRALAEARAALAAYKTSCPPAPIG